MSESDKALNDDDDEESVQVFISSNSFTLLFTKINHNFKCRWSLSLFSNVHAQ